MSITNPAKHLPRASRRTRGPEFAFAGTLLVAFAAMVASTKMLPSDLVLPVVSTIFFVPGALTLFGICVASQVDAEQMVRFVEGTHHRH